MTFAELGPPRPPGLVREEESPRQVRTLDRETGNLLKARGDQEEEQLQARMGIRIGQC